MKRRLRNLALGLIAIVAVHYLTAWYLASTDLVAAGIDQSLLALLAAVFLFVSRFALLLVLPAVAAGVLVSWAAKRYGTADDAP